MIVDHRQQGYADMGMEEEQKSILFSSRIPLWLVHWSILSSFLNKSFEERIRVVSLIKWATPQVQDVFHSFRFLIDFAWKLWLTISETIHCTSPAHRWNVGPIGFSVSMTEYEEQQISHNWRDASSGYSSGALANSLDRSILSSEPAIFTKEKQTSSVLFLFHYVHQSTPYIFDDIVYPWADRISSAARKGKYTLNLRIEKRGSGISFIRNNRLIFE